MYVRNDSRLDEFLEILKTDGWDVQRKGNTIKLYKFYAGHGVEKATITTDNSSLADIYGGDILNIYRQDIIDIWGIDI